MNVDQANRRVVTEDRRARVARRRKQDEDALRAEAAYPLEYFWDLGVPEY